MKAGGRFVGRKWVVVTALALIGVLGVAAVALAKPEFGGKWIGGGLPPQRQPGGVKPPNRITFRVDNNNVVKDFSWTRWSYFCEDQNATYEIEPYTMRDRDRLFRDGKLWKFILTDDVGSAASFTVTGQARPADKDRPKEGATAKGELTFQINLPGGVCNGAASSPDVRWEAEQLG